jgi:hypothetical protein
MNRFRWTPEHDKKIIDGTRKRMSIKCVSEMIGVSESSVKKRAYRLGLRFGRWNPALEKMGVGGHIPADKRSRELLRAAGVNI